MMTADQRDMAAAIEETPQGLAINVTIRLPHGLHSRPSARVAQAARKFASDILFMGNDTEVDAKSMLEILSLALKRNDQIRILANGPDAKEALLELCGLLATQGE